MKQKTIYTFIFFLLFLNKFTKKLFYHTDCLTYLIYSL